MTKDDPIRLTMRSTPTNAEDEEKHFGAVKEDYDALLPTTPFSPARETLLIFTVCMAQFLSISGLVQTIAPMNIVGNSFSTTDEGIISWYTAAFSLTVGTFILPAGRLGDMFGHRKICPWGYK